MAIVLLSVTLLLAPQHPIFLTLPPPLWSPPCMWCSCLRWPWAGVLGTGQTELLRNVPLFNGWPIGPQHGSVSPPLTVGGLCGKAGAPCRQLFPFNSRHLCSLPAALMMCACDLRRSSSITAPLNISLPSACSALIFLHSAASSVLQRSLFIPKLSRNLDFLMHFLPPCPPIRLQSTVTVLFNDAAGFITYKSLLFASYQWLTACTGD